MKSTSHFSLGSFLASTLLCGTPVWAGPPDVSQYVVAKAHRFVQTNAALPVLRTDAPPFEFSTFVELSTLGEVASVTLQKPDGSSITLSNTPGEGEFRIEDQLFGSSAALDTAFPNGEYQFTIVTLNQGAQTPRLRVGPGPILSTPRISNWAALREADSDGSITVRWDAMVLGRTNDFVQFIVEGRLGETIFTTGEPGTHDALNGTSTTVTIPARTLLPGHAYKARLLFARITFDMTAYPGALGIAEFCNETLFSIAIASPPPAHGFLAFTASDYSVSEGGGQVTVGVRRTGGTDGPVSVLIETQGGPAADLADYLGIRTTLFWADGDDSTTNLTFPIYEDSVLEGTETFAVVLSQPAGGAQLGAPSSAVVSILDNENAEAGIFRFSTSHVTVSESAGRALLTIVRDGGTRGEASVVLYPVSVSATAGLDFEDGFYIVRFGEGISSHTISVPILNDTLDEPDEGFFVVLSEPSGGASLGTKAAVFVSIADEDSAGLFGFSATQYSVSENGGFANITVRRSGGMASEATVDLFTLDETATVANDYSGTNVTLVFDANVRAITTSIPIKDNGIPDGDKTFRVRLANPTGGARLSSVTNSVVRILENEVTLQFTSLTYSNKESAVVAFAMIERSGPLNIPASVEFTTGSESAVAGQDYIGTNLVVQFPPGRKRKPIGVHLLKNQLVEGTKKLRLTLQNPGANTLIGPRDLATLSILDDDFGGRIQFAVSNLVVRESAAAANLVLTRSMGRASNVTVRLQTTDFGAVDGADYMGTNVVLEWRGNETRKVVSVPILQDALVEGIERFKATLSEATGGATLTNRTNLTVNITDDDKGGTIGFTRGTFVVNENATNALVIVTRSGGAASNVMVRLSTADGSASAAQPDYTPFDQLLAFGPGENIKTNLIPIHNDTLPEGPPETVLLTLREYTGGAKPGLSNAVISIVDDELSHAVLLAGTPFFRATMIGIDGYGLNRSVEVSHWGTNETVIDSDSSVSTLLTSTTTGTNIVLGVVVSGTTNTRGRITRSYRDNFTLSGLEISGVGPISLKQSGGTIAYGYLDTAGPALNVHFFGGWESGTLYIDDLQRDPDGAIVAYSGRMDIIALDTTGHNSTRRVRIAATFCFQPN